MRIISFIDQPDVIKKILQHLGLRPNRGEMSSPAFGLGSS